MSSFQPGEGVSELALGLVVIEGDKENPRVCGGVDIITV